jgi:hypothetical protein
MRTSLVVFPHDRSRRQNPSPCTCAKPTGLQLRRDPQRVERVADQRGELVHVRLVGRVEVPPTALVAQLQQAIDPAALSADARRQPAPHRRMAVRELPEAAVLGMRQHLGFRQPDDLAGRDRHPVQAVALRVDAEVAVRRVLPAQAEVLARLRRVLADPELQRRLLGAGQRARDPAGTAKERVELRRERRLGRRDIEDRRDLDPDLAGVRGTDLNAGDQGAFAADFHSSRRCAISAARSLSPRPSSTSRSEGSARR